MRERDYLGIPATGKADQRKDAVCLGGEVKRFYCDGASENGSAGWGFWIEDGQVCVEERHGGFSGTCNEAEWTAVLEATRTAKQLHESVEIVSDSQLIIYQLTGKWKLKAKNLFEFRRESLENLKGLEWSAFWIPRSLNERADELSKLDVVRKPGAFPKPSMYRAYVRQREHNTTTKGKNHGNREANR